MSDIEITTGSRSAAQDDAELQALLERAGARPEVPAEDLAAIKTAFRSAWRERLDRQSAWAWRRALLPLAAALLVAAGVGWWWRSVTTPEAPGVVAQVVALSGQVTLLSADGALALHAGQEVPLGTGLETTGAGGSLPGRIALRLADGRSLRLDAGSRVRLASATSLHLERGALYVDSGAAPLPGPGVEVHTSLGVAREIGTQFEVRLLESGERAMRVRVREGAVRLEADGGAYSANPGVELTLHADGSVEQEAIATHGPEWGWVLAAGPRFEIEGRTLGELLDWVGRETGWEVRYAGPELAAEAGIIRVHGDLGELTAAEAPAAVLPGAGLRHRLADGVLLIERDEG